MICDVGLLDSICDRFDRVVDTMGHEIMVFQVRSYRPRRSAWRYSSLRSKAGPHWHSEWSVEISVTKLAVGSNLRTQLTGSLDQMSK